MTDILCLSGGLDSYIAYHYLGKPPTIYFYTRQKHSMKEWKAVRRITENNAILDMSLDFSRNREDYIPHRNMLFASRASEYAVRVWIAGLKDDMVEDKTEKAFDIMGDCLSSIGKKPVIVDSPFWHMTKTDICKWFVQHKIDTQGLASIELELNTKSISCYGGGSEACHRCESCFRKSCAMFNAGMNSRFHNKKMVTDYYHKALNEEYIEERNADIVRYAEWYLNTGM